MSKRTVAVKWLRRALTLLLLLTPALISVALLQIAQGVWLWQAYPFWSDEIWYWHQAQAFAEVGLSSGYYTVKEIPAAFAGSAFNAWGMFIPMLYGTFAALLDWQLNSMILLNLAVLTLAIGILIRAMRPTLEQLMWLIVLFALYSPLWLYSFTSMITVLQLAISTALGAAFIILLRQREKTHRAIIIGLAIGIALASLVRLTWVVLYIPLVLLYAPRLSLRRTLFAFVLAGFAALIALLAMTQTGAPWPNVLGDVMATARTDLPTAISMIADNISTNLDRLDAGESYERNFRPAMAFFAGLLVVMALWLWLRKQRAAWPQLHAIGLILFLWGTLWLTSIVIYDVQFSRDFRLLAPVVLFGLIIVVTYRWRLVLVPVVITLILLLPDTWDVYRIWSAWHVDDEGRNAYHAWGTEFAKVVTFEPEAPNRWCNTLLHSHLYLWTQTSIVMSMPAGIGLSTTFEQADMPPPYQSRWLMLTDEEFSQWADQLDVTPLMAVPFGQLYHNNASACPD